MGIREAHALIKDLLNPIPWRYWRELLMTGVAGWTAFLLAATGIGSPVTTAGLTCLAALIWYRAFALIHELTHLSRAKIPGVHLAWNLVVGSPWLIPTAIYEGVHLDHHRKSTYGTANDPEYLPLAGRPWAIFGYLSLSFLITPIAMIRFLIATPISWLSPRFRRFLIRSLSSMVINPHYVRVMSTADQKRLIEWECIILLVWWPVIVLTILEVLPWRWLICWYATSTLALLVNRVRMLSAHHFASGGRPTDLIGQFRDSTDTPGGWWTELWAPVSMRYHALHHLFPALPYHNLGIAYRRLSSNLPAGSFYHESLGQGLLHSIVGLFRGSTSTK